MRVSISSLKAFKACPRMYWLKYHEGLEPVKQKSDALITGSNYHSLLETLYHDGSLIDVEEDNSKELAMACAYWKYIYPNFKVRSVEDWFEYSVTRTIKLVGRTDGIAEDGSLVEHKTVSGDIGEEYLYNLQWDEQILAYMLAKNTRKIYYTVIQKPTIKQKKTESDEEFFRRMIDWYDEETERKIRVFEITRTDEEVERFRKELLATCMEARRMERREERCYKNTAHCFKWGRQCDYAPVCLNYDPNLEYVQFVRKERNHDGN